METKWIVERQKQARRLLSWWEATNHPADRDSGLAVDTRRWLSWLATDVPEVSDSDLLYATDDPEEPSSLTQPEQGRSDTKVHDPDCERCLDLARMSGSGVCLGG